MREFYSEAEIQTRLTDIDATITAMASSKILPVIVEPGDRFVDQLVAQIEAYQGTKHTIVVFIAAADYRDFVLKAKFQSEARFEPTPLTKLRRAGYLGTLNGYAVYTNEGVTPASETPAKSAIFFLTK